MRGLDLLSPSHSPKLLADPELADLSVQINQMWPSLPEPLPLAWTETPLVSIDRSGVPWVIGPLVSTRRLEVVAMLRPGHQRMPVRLSKRTARRLWLVTALDMVAVAWMIAVGTWLDQTSRLTKVITLGGNHLLVLIMALVGFLVFASGAVVTNGFRSASKLGLTLITAGCIISVAALAGALSVLLLFMLGALLLGFLARMFLGR
jgi:hypothetical protein